MLTANHPTTIDLFAGAGGMSEGFREAGFQTIFANDVEEPATKTFARNHPGSRVVAGDIRDIDATKLLAELDMKPGDLDVLVGGPPCQGFSTYGQRSESDLRNQLYVDYLRFLDVFRPKTFVIENVVGMLSMSGGAVIDDIRQRLHTLGYGSDVWTLDASLYGVPQKRKRVFITGTQHGGLLDAPMATHGMRKLSQGVLEFSGSPLSEFVSVRDAISDLPPIALKPKETHKVLAYQLDARSEYQRAMRGEETKLTHHSAKQMLGIRRLRLALMRQGDWGTNIEERLKKDGLPDDLIDSLLGGGEALRDLSGIREQDKKKELALREKLSSGHTTIEELMEFMDSQGFANKYRRLSWSGLSHTLVAHMARDCSDFVHPQVDRFISVREAARLQSFPDSYYFEGSQFMQLRHIGNAVPPTLAAAVAGSVRKALNRASSLESEQTRLPRQQRA